MTDVRVLGPVQVSTEHGLARLRPREAAVVAALALGDQPLPAADIVHLIWTDPPASAVGAVRNHVSQLRRSMGRIASVGSGYRFENDVRVDARTLESVAARARAGDLDGDPAEQAATLRSVRASWRGHAFGELVSHPRVLAAREHLNGLRSVIDEELAAALLDAGQTERAHLLLEELVREAPRRSRRWSLLALACYRLGRRDDALAASMRANDFRSDADPADDEQLARIFRDDPELLTIKACPTTRRAVPIIGQPLEPRARRFGFVGREREEARLQIAIDEGIAPGATQEARVIAVEGEPGTGKTLIAYRAATAAHGRGMLALWSWCDAVPVSSFTVLGRLVQDLVAASGADRVAELAGPELPSLVELVPEADWCADHREGARGPVGSPTPSDVALRVLERAARTRPMICVVDDAQWASPHSLRSLFELVAGSARIVVVFVVRAGERPSGLVVPRSMTIELAELERDNVRRYLIDALEFSPPEGLVEIVTARTGGHPLLLREMVEAIEPMASRATAFSLASGPSVPRSIDDAAMRRLGSLRPGTRRAVRAASILGASFSPALLADIVDLDDDALADATAVGLIAPEIRRGRARFVHELVRLAIYEDLPSLTRAELHEAAGNALTNRKVPRWAEIAHHYAAAAELDPARAAAAHRRAGTEATRAFRFDDAAEHHRREVELLELAGETDVPMVVDALIEEGFALLRSGDPRMVEVAMRAALLARQRGDADRFARAMTVVCDMGLTSEAGAPDPELVELLDAALAGPLHPDRLAPLAAAGSYLFSLSGDWARCRELYDRAISCGASERAMAAVLPFASLALGGPDDLGRRAAAADELEVIGEHLGNAGVRAEALDVRLGVQIQMGDPRFRETLGRVIEMEREVSEAGSRWAICYLTATREHIDGDLAAAEEAAAAGLGSPGSGVAESRRWATYGAQIVALRADEGRLDELVPMLEDVVRDQPDLAAWRAVFVSALAASGASDRAGRMFDDIAADGFAALPRDFTWTAAMTLLARELAASGDARRARLVYDELGRYSGRMSWSGSCTFGPVDQALGEAAIVFGDEVSAAAHFSRAAEIATRLGAPRMLARARAARAPACPEGPETVS